MSHNQNRLRRSELSTPATSTKMIRKAATESAADLVFLDLEDAVAPASKEGARGNIVAALNELDWGSRVRAYRINGVQTPWCYGDVVEVVSQAGANLDVIIVPKVRAPRDVWFVDDLLTQLELKHGLEVGRIGIEVLIEETAALACVDEIAASSPRLEALILGVGDLAASQGIRVSKIGVDLDGLYPGDVWHYARTRLIVAARANGLDAIDGPFADFTNVDAYRDAANLAAHLGAVGKWCIHPAQLPIANEVFSPTSEQIHEATRVIDALEVAEADGLGAANLDGSMIDAASARIYRGVLERATQCGQLLAPDGVAS